MSHSDHPRPGPARSAAIAQTALAVLEHLRHEAEILARSLERTRALRSALLSGAFRTRPLEQLPTEALPDGWRPVRKRLRQRIADALGRPLEQATVQALAGCVPGPLADQLLATHQRLLNQVAEIDRLNRANAALIGHLLELTAQLTGAGAGGRAPAVRYSASGDIVRDDPPPGLGIHIRC